MAGDDVSVRFDGVVAEQDGYFTEAQAFDAGFAVPDIVDNLDDGSWTRVETDLYRLSLWPRHDLEGFSKWCAWLGESAAISHQSAAELHGMGTLHPQFVHVRVGGTARAHDRRLAIHRGRLEPEDVEFTGTFRLTTPTRTVLDLAAGGISQFTLDEIVADGLLLGRLSVDELFEQAVGCGDRVAERIELALR
ncbi:MAG: hypothetical protein WBF79_02800 [Rhodococcus sp. (in: high G+C Gram-positive bacteria)]